MPRAMTRTYTMTRTRQAIDLRGHGALVLVEYIDGVTIEKGYRIVKTRSELLFEGFLAANEIPFEKIEEAATPRPDYLVATEHGQIVFELKELTKDEGFGVVKDQAYPQIFSHSGIVGDHVRRQIHGSRKQIQYGAKQGIPSVLLIYNALDPLFQLFGTETHDFIAAMYGAYTVLINPCTKSTSDWFNGRGQKLTPDMNTSFSAIGHLSDRGGQKTVMLFENAFAKVPINYDCLSPCFEVTRIEVSDDSLVVS